MNITDKLEWIKKTYKAYVPGEYFRLKDYPNGWSDGALADLVGMFREEIEAKMILKRSKPSFHGRVILEQKDGPATEPVVQKTINHTNIATDITPVITDCGLMIDLIAENKKTVRVDPQLLRHFLQYVDLVFKFGEDNEPVRIESSDGILIGLLMPIRTHGGNT